MDQNMFCFQCEQTAGCTGCTGRAGVCGKSAGVAALQDELTGALIGLARATDSGAAGPETWRLLIEGLFTTVTNVNFNEKTLRALLDRVRAEGNQHIFVEDSLEALCEKTGIPLENLRDTITTYNGWCDQGRDGQFGKMPKFLRPVREGKYYCFRVYTTAYQTIGGLKVDGNARVLDEEEKPIGGLYAAGDIIAAELFGDPPICGIGNAGIALCTGIIAGRDAVARMEEEES